MPFTPEERTAFRSALLARARQDKGIVSAAITGSAASGREDAWSDVDLAFGTAGGVSLDEVLSDWTAHMYGRNAAVHHIDTRFGKWVYRTFLLANTLQVDLAFVPSDHFRPLGPGFELLFSTAREPARFDDPTSAQMNAASVAAAQSARACIARGELWKADSFLGVARDHALMSACIDRGLPYHHGRGFDLLPEEIRVAKQDAFAATLTENELRRALSALDGARDGSAGSSASPAAVLVDADRAIGFAWLYALHARSSMMRKKVWQAEYMVRGLRDHTAGLARLRSGGTPGTPLYAEPLPEAIDSGFRDTRLRAFHSDELTRAFGLLIGHLGSEISSTGVPQAARLQQTILALRQGGQCEGDSNITTASGGSVMHSEW